MNENKPQGFFDGNPKMIFIFGLVCGIALTFILGGSLPSLSLGGDDSDVVRTFDNDDADDSGDADEVDRSVLAAVTGDEWIRGDIENAGVVLVEYSDYECPFCSRHHPTMQQIMEEYGDDVAWVYRHFPLTSIHAEAEPSANASECVGYLAGNDAFWVFTDALIERQDELGDDLYLELAREAGIGESEFTECYENEVYAEKVAEDVASARAAGVSGTPATFVNGVLVSGAVPFESFADLIDTELGK